VVRSRQQEKEATMTVIVGFFLGLVAGAATGTMGAAFGGAMVGMSIGIVIYGVGWMRSHLGNAPTVERHLVMCTPYGHAAACEFEGDLETKRWYDVKSCSLLQEPTHVDCNKGCLRQLTLAGVRPGEPCSCHVDPGVVAVSRVVSSAAALRT
jgi:hypothetical protein